MNLYLKSFSSLILAMVLSTVALADNELIVADDSSSGTYKQMLGEVISLCSDENLTIKEAAGVTGGAVGNLNALVSNKASAAFLHSDVIFASAQSDPSYRQLKTLVALYPEDIHVLALRNSVTSKVGMTNWGKQEFNSLSDLAGFKVGAAGGGVYTSHILQGQGEGKFSVVEYPTGKDVIAALDSGEISAAIFVGGAPLPNLVNLSGEKYKLLPIGDTIAGKVSGVYKPTVINYPNLRSGAVKTLAPWAIILTRKYTIPKMVVPQQRFRECFYKHLEELQQTPGYAPKWSLVDPADHGVWDWYDIPTIATTPSKK